MEESMKHTKRARSSVLACLLCVGAAACDSGSEEPKSPPEGQVLDASMSTIADAALPPVTGKDDAAVVVRPPPPTDGDLGQNSQNDTFLRADTVLLAAPKLVAKPFG